MARGVSNFSGISNNDLVLLRKGATKHSRITIKAGTTRIEIEGTEVSIIKGGDLVFLSIPATNAIFRSGELVTNDEDVKSAIRELKSIGRAKPKRAKKEVPELPEELKRQLEAFAKETNSRVIFDPSGSGHYKVQKLRPRRKSSK